MKRWWLPYALATLALLVAIVSLWRTAHLRVPEPPSVTPVHHFAVSEPASPSFYANARAIGEFYVTDPLFGAIGDDSHDDTAAINAATAAALGPAGGDGGVQIGTVIFPPAPVAYKVTSEIQGNGPIHWRGDSSGVAQTIIRAHGALEAILSLRGTFGLPVGQQQATRPDIERLTFDANGAGNATYGIILNGAVGSRMYQTSVINSPGHGVRSAFMPNPLTLSGITATVPGGSPVGVTVTQPDPHYAQTQNPSPATLTIRMKCVVGGALGTAQYVTSYNGGSTYQTVQQPISATTPIGVQDASSVPNLTSFGVVASWPAGTYHVNDTWQFTATTVAGDTGAIVNLNSDMQWTNTYFQNTGSMYATAGAQAVLGSYRYVTAPGSVAIAAGSNVIVGTGTTFTSIPAIEGMPVLVNTSPAFIAPLSMVLDDTHLTIIIGTEPTTTVSGIDYAIGTGGGYWEDGNQDNGSSTWHGVWTMNTPFAFRFAGNNGPTMTQPTMETYAITGLIAGGSSFNSTTGTRLIGPHAESPGPVFLLSPLTNGTIIEPIEVFSFAGAPGSWIVQRHGAVYPLSTGTQSSLPLFSFSLVPSTLTVNAGTLIPAPDATVQMGHTSAVYLRATAQIVMNGVPTVGAPGQDGQQLKLINVGAFPITFQDTHFSSSNLRLNAQYITIGAQESLSLRSQNGAWWQTDPLSSTFVNGLTGNHGIGKKIAKTTTNAATVIWDLDVLNSGISAGTLARFDVKAQARSAQDVAFWHDCVLMDDAFANRLGYACSHYAATSGNAATWTMHPVLSSPNENITITGDNSGNAVFWEIQMQAESPPSSF